MLNCYTEEGVKTTRYEYENFESHSKHIDQIWSLRSSTVTSDKDDSKKINPELKISGKNPFLLY
jgi:hypothetical protein